MHLESHFTNPICEQIWRDRYEKNGEGYDGNLRRVAKFVASAEKPIDRDYWEDKFYYLMQSGYFFPAGRTMSNSGIGKKLTLNNCFTSYIVPNSMEGIFDCVRLGAVTHKAGGGIGYNFSNLSPRGMATNNDAIASGPVSFMDVFNAQTRTVQQGSRRGANMGVLSVYHPDILEFVNAKANDQERLNHFNLSVMVDDDFMQAVVDDGYIYQHWPIYDDYGRKLEEKDWNPEYTKRVRATEIWNVVMQRAYDNGEPGVLFQDTMNDFNPAYYVENIVGTNPCSEYIAGTVYADGHHPSEFGGACNLGSIFLHNFVDNPFTRKATINMPALTDAIQIAVRMLDNIIDVNKFPDKIYENYQKNMRTIGLGYTGLADMLAMLGVRYNSREALELTNDLLRQCTEIAYGASVSLARERGAFPLCDAEKHANSTFAQMRLSEELRADIARYGIRNAKLQAVAPCGTISMAYGNNCSSGIEPIFSLSYDRKVKIGGQDDVNEQVVHMMDYAYWLYHHIIENGGSVDFKENDIFVTALEMSVEEHIGMLEVVANNTDMSVSKTINVPTDYPFDAVKQVYVKCWEHGIKGCTIFRPNALRPGILMSPDSKNGEEGQEAGPAGENTSSKLSRGDIIQCDDQLIGKKRKLTTGCGSLHVLAYFDPVTGDMQEVYLNKGSTGGCGNFMTGLSRMISLALRAGVNVSDLRDQLDSTGVCPSYATRRAVQGDTSRGSCCPMAIGNALVEMQQEMRSEVIWEDENAEEIDEDSIGNEGQTQHAYTALRASTCPECGEPLYAEGGCQICKACGWSKCE